LRLTDWLTFTPVFLRCLGKLPLKHLLYLARQMRFEYPHHCGDKLYINTFFPPYPSPAFDRFLLTVIEKRRIPYSAYFAVTDQCPARCPHCSYGNHQPGRLNTQDAQNILRQIKQLGAITIGLTGGEPLLRPDIIQLVETIGPDTASILFTTGFNLTADLAKQLKRAGLHCLMIGLESDNPAQHNAVRNLLGSFDQAMKAIEFSLNAGLYTAVSTVGSKSKVQEGVLPRIAQLASRLSVHEFRILEPIPTGSMFDQPEEILSPQDSQAIARFHQSWNRNHRGPSIASFSRLESDAMFGCGAGYHHLFIDAIGSVCPCDLTPLSFGNALRTPLRQIWEEMETFFPHPRCGCFMRTLAADPTFREQSAPFPLNPELSRSICNRYPHNRDLPAIYKNYLSGP